MKIARDKVQVFTKLLAAVIRDNGAPAVIGQTTTGSAMIVTEYDGTVINVTITAARSQQ